MNKFDPAAYVASLNIDDMRFRLSAVSELLARLGNPQKCFKTILIAGTNGKGSTAAMTASMLRSAGYRTGLYTSPHLIDVRERIAVDGKEISRKNFSRIIASVKNKILRPVTYFEVLTAGALLYFQQSNVDIAVLEVGLGGRLDATNVCRPLVSVITNIGFDHMAYLGNNLESIAGEKAGIIKYRGVCITAAKQKKVVELFSDICRRRKARLYLLGRDMKIGKKKDGSVFYRGLTRNMPDIKIPLIGRHQLDNAALALAATEIIGKKGFPVDVTAAGRGLKNTIWKARLEVLNTEPLLVVDGAHNPAGMEVLRRALAEDFIYRRLILIFSALADKDYYGMLRKILPAANFVILIQLQSRRAVEISELRRNVEKMGCRAVIARDAADAVRRAFSLAGRKDMILAAGSLYLAGDIKRAFPEVVSCDKKQKLSGKGNLNFD